MNRLLMILVLGSSLALADANVDSVSTDGASPVPEPATIGLMGAGIAAIGFAAWRKNRKK